MAKRNNLYTVMFVPEDHGKTFSLRVHKNVIRSLLLFLAVFTVGLALLLFKAGEIAAKLQLVSSLKAENVRIAAENSLLRQISERLDRVERLSSYIEHLAVIPGTDQEQQQTGVAPSLAGAEQHTDNPATQLKRTDASTKGVPHVTDASPEQSIASIPNIPPVEGWITRQFSTDQGSDGHLGLDFAAASGTPIRATAPGVVQDVRNDKYFGLLITIRHDLGFLTRYGHCSQVLTSPRAAVERGQTIALVGSTGRSTAPHLHYEIVKDGRNLNPADYLIAHQE